MNAALSLANVRIGASFLWKLPFFLRHPISVEQARTALRERLERREVGFLALARRTILRGIPEPRTSDSSRWQAANTGTWSGW
jgi:hypothetical protein